MFTFDTNALIYYLAGKEGIIDFIEQNKDALYFIPTVVIVEFLSFKELDTKTLILFERFLKDLIIINLDLEIAKKAGELRRNYNLKTIDAIVAASAIITNTTLITYNTRDFQKIRELKIISP